MKVLINTYYLFQFDRKTMGSSFYVPILMFFLTSIFIMFQDGDAYMGIIIIQGIFIPFTCWGFMYRLVEVYEDGAKETLVPFYTKWIVFDALRYIVLNTGSLLLLSGLFMMKYGSEALTLLNVVHVILLMVFFQFLGSTLVVLFKNIELALTLVFIYTIIEVITLGQFMPWPHIFIFEKPLSFFDMFGFSKVLSFIIYIPLLIFLTMILLKNVNRKVISLKKNNKMFKK